MTLRSLSSALLILLAALCLTACGADEPDPGPGPTPQPMPQPDEPDEAARMVLVYMLADNTLGRDGFDADDIAEMRAAVAAGGLGDDGRLLLYHNRYGTSRGLAPVLVELLPSGVADTLAVFPDNPSINSATPERIVEVAAMADEAAPALSRGLVLWSHGTGWITDSASRSAAVADTPVASFGNDRGTTLSLPDLAEALELAGPWDFIYFDCCHMATVEVAYELRRAAPVMVASPTELPAEGMRYDINIPHFFALPDADLLGAAQATFSYFNGLTGSARTCTMTCIDLTSMDFLAAAAANLMASAGGAALDRRAYQRYMRAYSSNTLYDLRQHLANLSPAAPADALADFDSALADAVVWHAETPWVFSQLQLTDCCGLATFITDFATADQAADYASLAWARDVVNTHYRQ